MVVLEMQKSDKTNLIHHISSNVSNDSNQNTSIQLDFREIDGDNAVELKFFDYKSILRFLYLGINLRAVFVIYYSIGMVFAVTAQSIFILHFEKRL